MAPWVRGCFALALALIAAAATAGEADPETHLSPPIAPGVWLHLSYLKSERWGWIRSNGLVVARGEDEALLVDTAWNDEQTRDVLELVRTQLGRRVVGAVSTHAHEDKMGGVGALQAAGVATYAHPVSNSLAPGRGLQAAEFDLPIGADGRASAAALAPLEVFYPGAGHTVENLVVHVPAAGVLFGGCLIRPGGTRTLGNTADGDIDAWGASVQAAAERFPDASIVVPSHGHPGGRELLSHTAALAQAAATSD